jgi:hypothetical protein
MGHGLVHAADINMLDVCANVFGNSYAECQKRVNGRART